MRAVEKEKIRDALDDEEGNLARAAAVLDVSASGLRYTIENHHPHLIVEAKRMRKKNGNPRGRPRIPNKAHDRDVFTEAWRKSSRDVINCAAALDIPVTTCRRLVVRHGLPKPKRR